MQKLLSYINALPKVQRHVFAKSCNTSVGYLRKAASTGQSLGSKLCVAIERATGGQVTRFDLCPGDAHEIWPEAARERGREAAREGA